MLTSSKIFFIMTKNEQTSLSKTLHETSWDNINKIKEPKEAYKKFLNILSYIYESFFQKTQSEYNLKTYWTLGQLKKLENLPRRNKDFMENISKNGPSKMKKSIKIIKVFLNLLKKKI